VIYATLGVVDYSATDLITDSKLLTWESMKNESERFRNLFGDKSYTKKEICDILRENGFITEEGLLGRIQGEMLFNGEYPTGYGLLGHPKWYEFKRSENDRKEYQLVEKVDLF